MARFGGRLNQRDGEKENPFAAYSIKAEAERSGGSTVTSRRPRPKPVPLEEEEEVGGSMFDFDPEFTGALSRNFQFFRRVFSLETFLRPLPAPIAMTLARNFGFFTRIFTQFLDPRGIKNAQMAMGIRKDDSNKGRHQLRRK